MTDTENIKVVSGNALNVVRKKSSIAISIIWLFSVFAGAFIYFNNKGYLTLPDHAFNARALNKYSPLTTGNDSAKSAFNGNNKKSLEESYVLVQYNKRLILTRYTSISQKDENKTTLQQLQTTTNPNHPVIIKRQINKPSKPNSDFSIKSIPQ
jgi:hypothetical protein